MGDRFGIFVKVTGLLLVRALTKRMHCTAFFFIFLYVFLYIALGSPLKMNGLYYILIHENLVHAAFFATQSASFCIVVRCSTGTLWRYIGMLLQKMAVEHTKSCTVCYHGLQ